MQSSSSLGGLVVVAWPPISHDHRLRLGAVLKIIIITPPYHEFALDALLWLLLLLGHLMMMMLAHKAPPDKKTNIER